MELVSSLDGKRRRTATLVAGLLACAVAVGLLGRVLPAPWPGAALSLFAAHAVFSTHGFKPSPFTGVMLGALVFTGTLTALPAATLWLTAPAPSEHLRCGTGSVGLFMLASIAALVVASVACLRYFTSRRPRNRDLEARLINLAGLVIAILIATR